MQPFIFRHPLGIFAETVRTCVRAPTFTLRWGGGWITTLSPVHQAHLFAEGGIDLTSDSSGPRFNSYWILNFFFFIPVLLDVSQYIYILFSFVFFFVFPNSSRKYIVYCKWDTYILPEFIMNSFTPSLSDRTEDRIKRFPPIFPNPFFRKANLPKYFFRKPVSQILFSCTILRL